MTRVLLASALLLSSIALGKAYYAPKIEMLLEADVVAIVDILDTRAERNQGRYFWFQKVAAAKVEKVLKGIVPDKFEILWKEEFICDQCEFKKGRHLVFLRKDGLKWSCSNWYLSVRPITDNTLEWYKDNGSTGLSVQSLENVLKDISSELARPGKPNRKKSVETQH
jgi:hypothetical protein